MKMMKGLLVLAALVAFVAKSVSSAALDIDTTVCGQICRAIKQDIPECMTPCINDEAIDFNKLAPDLTAERFCRNFCVEIGKPNNKCIVACTACPPKFPSVDADEAC